VGCKHSVAESIEVIVCIIGVWIHRDISHYSYGFEIIIIIIIIVLINWCHNLSGFMNQRIALSVSCTEKLRLLDMLFN
jgi:hypothetical protein